MNFWLETSTYCRYSVGAMYKIMQLHVKSFTSNIKNVGNVILETFTGIFIGARPVFLKTVDLLGFYMNNNLQS